MEAIAATGEEEYRAKAEQAAAQLAAQFPRLEVKIAGSWVWISGDTRPHRAELKAAGLRWAPKKGKWYLKGRPRMGRRPMSWEYIVSKYGLDDAEQVAA